jgi:hypothetical protein
MIFIEKIILNEGICMKTIENFKLKPIFEKQTSTILPITKEIIEMLKCKSSSNGTLYKEGDVIYSCFVYEYITNNITNGEKPNILCKCIQMVESEFEYYENNFLLEDDEKNSTPVLIKK